MTNDELLTKLNRLKELANGPVGLTYDNTYGSRWPVFRFAEMDKPGDEPSNSEICEILTDLLEL